MEFTNDELLFILDALKRREVELFTSGNERSESYKTAIELQGKIIYQRVEQEVNAVV